MINNKELLTILNEEVDRYRHAESLLMKSFFFGRVHLLASLLENTQHRRYALELREKLGAEYIELCKRRLNK